jgi:hypothetical protein
MPSATLALATSTSVVEKVANLAKPTAEHQSRSSLLPLKADIADQCQRLNEQQAALDAKTDTSDSTAELATLRKGLRSSKRRFGQQKTAH